MNDVYWMQLVRQQQKIAEMMPQFAAAMKKIRERKALKDMKITDKNWQLLLDSASEFNEAREYSLSRGIHWHARSKDYYTRLPAVWCPSKEYGLASAINDSKSITITMSKFKQMCDEYAAENKPKSLFDSQTEDGEFYCLVDGINTSLTINPHATYEAAKVEARRLVETHGKPVRILRAMLEIKPAGRYIETEL